MILSTLSRKGFKFIEGGSLFDKLIHKDTDIFIEIFWGNKTEDPFIIEGLPSNRKSTYFKDVEELLGYIRMNFKDEVLPSFKIENRWVKGPSEGLRKIKI